METQTVKLPKALPIMLRKVMPGIVVATKYSQGKKDLGDLIFGHRRNENTSSLLLSVETPIC